jgi:methylated-DNA-[protein]-cysteine S-methyltransferase
LAVASLETPIGQLHVAASGAGLMRVVFPEHRDHGVLAPLAGERSASRAAARARATAAEQLGGYFSGELRSFDVPIDWSAADERHRAVLDETALVPYGDRRAYHRLDGDARAVGTALGANPLPIVVPCHRVGRAPDDPVDYTGGVERKRALQAIETAAAAK